MHEEAAGIAFVYSKFAFLRKTEALVRVRIIGSELIVHTLRFDAKLNRWSETVDFKGVTLLKLITSGLLVPLNEHERPVALTDGQLFRPVTREELMASQD